MKTISLKMPEWLDLRLEEAARARRISKSAVVREALEGHLASDPAAGRPSVAGLAMDLAGTVCGPADLSSSPRHMDGFGG